MKKLYAITTIVVVSLFCAACGDDHGTNTTSTGTISGSISPEDASVRIIAKTAGTDYQVEGNIKGEVTLTGGGDFTIKGLPEGTYDLLFILQGEPATKYIASHWSEVVVKPGESTLGINYRLTPQGSAYMIDEVLVSFSKSVSDANAREVIRSLGCIIKDSPLDLGQVTVYVVDISVEDMIMIFTRQSSVLSAEPNGIATLQGM